MDVSCDIVVASQAGWKSGLEVASEDPSVFAITAHTQ